MAIAKTAFTSRDIQAAFGMTNREQVYLVDRGYLVPDIQSDRPRLYSLYSAMKAGAIQFFSKQGYKLDRAERLSEILMVTATEFIAMVVKNSRERGPQLRMEVKDGELGVVYFLKNDGERWEVLYFNLDDERLFDDAEYSRPDFLSGCVYNLTMIWKRLSGKLDSDWTAIGRMPEYVEKKMDFVDLKKEDPAKLIKFKGA